MRIRRFVFLLFLLGGPADLIADVYRCPGDQGEVLYSQRPCGADGTTVIEGPLVAPGPAVGLRASEVRWLRGRERENTSRRARKPPLRKAATRSSTADKQAYRCQRKNNQLDALRSKLRRGYKPAQGERLRSRRRVLEDYLSEFCS